MSKLITFAYLRAECDISSNIEDKVLDNPIKQAQETLRMILSEAFYAEIVSQFDSKTLSAANTALLTPYLKQYIAWQAYEFWAMKANVNPTRSGFRIHADESSQIAPAEDMATVLRSAEQRAAFYKGLMIVFLNKNSSNYALYTPSCRSNTFGTGMHITSISKKPRTFRSINREKYNDY